MGLFDRIFGKKTPTENYNQAVYTLKQIFQGAPILLVVHDEDGEWQFLTGEMVTEADMMLVSLADVLKRDASLKQVLDIPLGSSATRVKEGSSWVVERHNTC